jgi:acyl-CoA synthetase (AMP-forming)/AMP-acid ligase II
MIITGGENISPAEIESVLSLHPAVAEVAVAGLPHERLGHQVTAFVKRASAIDAASLDARCRASPLADYKRPRAWALLTSQNHRSAKCCDASSSPENMKEKPNNRHLAAGCFATPRS